MTAAATGEGICLLEFTDRRIINSELEELAWIFNAPVGQGSNRHLRALKKQLKEYFKGKRKEFSLSLVTPGTDFQKSVWDIIREDPVWNNYFLSAAGQKN